MDLMLLFNLAALVYLDYRRLRFRKLTPGPLPEAKESLHGFM